MYAELGLLEEETLVEARARVVEAPIHLRGSADALEVGEREWMRHRERLEALAPLPQRTIEQHLVAGHEQVPGDVDHRHRGHQRVIRRHPSQPRLQCVEGHHSAVVESEDLAVEHHVRAEMLRTGTDLGKLRRDVLEVAAVQGNPRAATVELAPDAVILVFNPHVLAEACDRLGGVGDRRREHGSQRHEPVRGRLRQTARAGEEGCLAGVAGEHHRSAHRRLIDAEGGGDRFLHQPFAQPDAQLGGDELGDVPGLVRGRALEERRGAAACAPVRRVRPRSRQRTGRARGATSTRCPLAPGARTARG